jgi:hypothetical protein
MSSFSRSISERSCGLKACLTPLNTFSTGLTDIKASGGTIRIVTA